MMEEDRRRQLCALRTLGHSLLRAHTLEEVFHALVAALREGIPRARSLAALVVDPEGGTRFWADSPDPESLEALQRRLGEARAGEAACLTPRGLVPGEPCAVLAPLVCDEPFGCLYLGAGEEGALDESHLGLVDTVAWQGSLAFRKALLLEERRRQAVVDGLTGLYGHRHFQEKLEEEVKRARWSGASLCLLLVDLDMFEFYNDTLGHLAGDALLREAADLLRTRLRSTDLVCRYGSDEFAVILRECPPDQAIRLAEILRGDLELRFSSREVPVTCSIGWACLPEDGADRKQLLRAAQAAVVRARRSGGNRVRRAEE